MPYSGLSLNILWLPSKHYKWSGLVMSCSILIITDRFVLHLKCEKTIDYANYTEKLTMLRCAERWTTINRRFPRWIEFWESAIRTDWVNRTVTWNQRTFYSKHTCWKGMNKFSTHGILLGFSRTISISVIVGNHDAEYATSFNLRWLQC